MKASNDVSFAAFATRLRVAHDATDRAGADPEPGLPSDVSALGTPWPSEPGRWDSAKCASANDAFEKISIDMRARVLLERTAAGDEAAFEEFYRLLSRRVQAYVRRMIRDVDTADEVVVDTMHEVWKTAGRYRRDSQVTTWLLGIARNKALVAIRRRPKADCDDIDDFADSIPSDAPDGFAVLARKQTQEMIRNCMQSLSAKHRECLHLTYFEDMSTPEIARMLGIPEGTVKSRLSHARVLLAARVALRMRS